MFVKDILCMTGLCKVGVTHQNVVRWFKRKSCKVKRNLKRNVAIKVYNDKYFAFRLEST